MVTDSTLTPSVEVVVRARVRHTTEQDIGPALQQRLFATECAECHGAPAATGRYGGDLYAAVCAMCHPDPGALVARGAALRDVTARGDLAHRMPAYDKGAGGPLSERQIDSLVEYIGTK